MLPFQERLAAVAPDGRHLAFQGAAAPLDRVFCGQFAEVLDRGLLGVRPPTPLGHVSGYSRQSPDSGRRGAIIRLEAFFDVLVGDVDLAHGKLPKGHARPNRFAAVGLDEETPCCLQTVARPTGGRRAIRWAKSLPVCGKAAWTISASISSGETVTWFCLQAKFQHPPADQPLQHVRAVAVHALFIELTEIDRRAVHQRDDALAHLLPQSRDRSKTFCTRASFCSSSKISVATCRILRSRMNLFSRARGGFGHGDLARRRSVPRASGSRYCPAL